MEKESKEILPWLITKNKYNLDEVVSALQKSIRRGLEEDSLYWAMELAKSGYGQYLWRRLCVIVSEDIGLANPLAPIVINSLAENCKRCTKSWKDPEMLPIAHAILYLCRSYKNREVDDFIEYIKLKIKGGCNLEVPEWAKDVHTEAGKKIIKNKKIDPIKKFYKEGCLLNKEKQLKEGNLYKEKLYKKLNLNHTKELENKS